MEDTKIKNLGSKVSLSFIHSSFFFQQTLNAWHGVSTNQW